jgi:pseudomonalisin
LQGHLMPPARRSYCLLTLAFASVALHSASILAQSTSEALETALVSVAPHDRIVQLIDDNQRVQLEGNTLPFALPAYETGSVDGGTPFARMVLVLQPDPEQQAALDRLTAAQQDAASPLYHQWLTPATYAAHFGASEGDIEQIQDWLESNGFRVEEVAASHQSLIFSGTAAQVESAFQTTMKTYRIAGQQHIANASDPSIPATLAPVVMGVESLHDLFSAPQHTPPVKASSEFTVKPEFTSGSAHYLSPADYATIYDIGPLYNQAYTGSGETIAIAGRADISLADVRSFRSTFGLPAKDPVTILNGPTNPGSAVTGDVDEAMLDTEWSGAVARNATVDFVTSASTATSDGVFLSAQYIVDHNLAPIMSVSYGLCEADFGASANAFVNALWEQAAAEGITVVVSAGDSGAAGCDSSSATKATHGRGVNGICSTPYSTCVGGTEFNDTANSALYWDSTTGANGESARSYIPEDVWKESGSSGLWSTGGGVSMVYAKPSWQAGKGVPADGKRDVPDVALTAAGHDAYMVRMWGALYGISGTSAASPSFAGILALAAQKAGSRLGNANPELYHLAAAQYSDEAAVFHDITTGNNSVPGVTGFAATAGYDQTTGWGSVDAEKLVTSWGTAAASNAAPTLSLSLSSSSVTLAKTGAATTLTTAVGGGLSSLVSLSVSGLPAGLTANFKPTLIAAPGAGRSVLTLTPGAGLTPGSWTLTVTAGAGSVSQRASLTVALPGLRMTLTPGSTSLRRGSTLPIELTTKAAGGFSSAISFAVSGLPSGVTAEFSPSKLAAPGSGSSTLTLTASKTATLGAAKIQVTVTGSGLSGVAAAVPFTVDAASPNSRAHKL